MSDGFDRVRGGWLIDGTGGPVGERVLVCLQGGRIASIRADRSASPPTPQGSDELGTLDLSGCTLVPGLVDAHVHLFMSGCGDPDTRKTQLALPYDQALPVMRRHIEIQACYGVVALRDGGDYGGHALRLAVEHPEITDTGPCLRVAGRAWRAAGRYGALIGRPPPAGSSLSKAVGSCSDPAHHVKVVNSGLNSLLCYGRETPPQFTSAELRGAVRAAHAAGRKVMVHANGRVPVARAVEAGCDSVEHGFFMGLRNLERMAKHGTVWVPTLFTMEAYAAELPPGSREAETARRNVEHQLRQVAAARELGVRVAAGSDAGSLGVHHGDALRHELRMLMRAGFPLQEAVMCATRNGADLLGVHDRTGTLAAGMPASFVAVRCTPADLPEALVPDRIEAVVLDGVLLALSPAGRATPCGKESDRTARFPA